MNKLTVSRFCCFLLGFIWASVAMGQGATAPKVAIWTTYGDETISGGSGTYSEIRSHWNLFRDISGAITDTEYINGTNTFAMTHSNLMVVWLPDTTHLFEEFNPAVIPWEIFLIEEDDLNDESGTNTHPEDCKDKQDRWEKYECQLQVSDVKGGSADGRAWFDKIETIKDQITEFKAMHTDGEVLLILEGITLGYKGSKAVLPYLNVDRETWPIQIAKIYRDTGAGVTACEDLTQGEIENVIKTNDLENLTEEEYKRIDDMVSFDMEFPLVSIDVSGDGEGYEDGCLFPYWDAWPGFDDDADADEEYRYLDPYASYSAGTTEGNYVQRATARMSDFLVGYLDVDYFDPMNEIREISFVDSGPDGGRISADEGAFLQYGAMMKAVADEHSHVKKSAHIAGVAMKHWYMRPGLYNMYDCQYYNSSSDNGELSNCASFDYLSVSLYARGWGTESNRESNSDWNLSDNSSSQPFVITDTNTGQLEKWFVDDENSSTAWNSTAPNIEMGFLKYFDDRSYAENSANLIMDMAFHEGGWLSRANAYYETEPFNDGYEEWEISEAEQFAFIRYILRDLDKAIEDYDSGDDVGANAEEGILFYTNSIGRDAIVCAGDSTGNDADFYNNFASKFFSQIAEDACEDTDLGLLRHKQFAWKAKPALALFDELIDPDDTTSGVDLYENDFDNDGYDNYVMASSSTAIPVLHYNATEVDDTGLTGYAVDYTLGETDNCPLWYNPDQTDTDGDGVGDVCDNCKDDVNEIQKDFDQDGIGAVCDSDDTDDSLGTVAESGLYCAGTAPCPNPNIVSQHNDSDGDGIVNSVEIDTYWFDPNDFRSDIIESTSANETLPAAADRSGDDMIYYGIGDGNDTLVVVHDGSQDVLRFECPGYPSTHTDATCLSFAEVSFERKSSTPANPSYDLLIQLDTDDDGYFDDNTITIEGFFAIDQISPYAGFKGIDFIDGSHDSEAALGDSDDDWLAKDDLARLAIATAGSSSGNCEGDSATDCVGTSSADAGTTPHPDTNPVGGEDLRGPNTDSDQQIFGRDGNDFIVGYDGEDHLFGEGDGDTLWGGSGDDLLFGDSGADTLRPDAGTDYMDGGTGLDIYQLDEDSGTNTISNLDYTTPSGSNRDQIEFQTGVATSDVKFGLSGTPNPVDLVVTVTVGGTSSTTTIDDYFGIFNPQVLLDFTFVDSSDVWDGKCADSDEDNDGVYDDPRYDYDAGRTGEEAGCMRNRLLRDLSTSGADTITAWGESDFVDAGAGDDVVYGQQGTDHLVGGSGDDVLVGQRDSDTYVIDDNSSDTDVIHDLCNWYSCATGTEDIVVFDDHDSSALTFAELDAPATGPNGNSTDDDDVDTDSDDLKITFSGTSQQLWIIDHDHYNDKVEYFKDKDGDCTTHAALKAQSYDNTQVTWASGNCP